MYKINRWLDEEATTLPTEPLTVFKKLHLFDISWRLFLVINTQACCLDLRGLTRVWPDWAIYWTLGDFLKTLATINLPKSLLGNFCKGVKIYHFSSEIIFGQRLLTFGDFYLSGHTAANILDFYSQS